MVKKAAWIISLLLHPLLMPTILFSILLFFTSYLGSNLHSEGVIYLLAVIFITTCLLPLFCVAVLKFTNNISSYGSGDKKDRIIPFFFISMFYAVTTYMFATKIKLGQVYLVVISSITILLFILTIITFFWKISAHSAAVSGVVGFIFGIGYKYADSQLLWPLAVVTIMAGLVMSSSLYLNAHKPSEILGGSLLGFFFSFTSVYLFA